MIMEVYKTYSTTKTPVHSFFIWIYISRATQCTVICNVCGLFRTRSIGLISVQHRLELNIPETTHNRPEVIFGSYHTDSRYYFRSVDFSKYRTDRTLLNLD